MGRPGLLPDEQMSGHDHAAGTAMWKKATILGAFPAVILGTINALAIPDEHAHDCPEFRQYEYLHLRSKKFPWGDGNHSLFHNKHMNALPEGYETEAHH